MRWFIREILPLLVIVAIVLVLTLVPYFNTKARLASDERNTQIRLASNARISIYLCRFSAIMREFANTAADARRVSALAGPPSLRESNFHAAKVYIHVRNELKKLPPDSNCKKLLQGAK